MKGVRCSWVDMQKIREALAAGERGDQSRLEHMRCVDKSTVSDWRAACDLLDALEGKVGISQLSSFQPSHAREITRSLRRDYGPADGWGDEVKEEAADLVNRCEADGLTVQQLKTILREKTRPPVVQNTFALASLDKLVAAGATYGTILADPPWQYDNQSTRGATDDHYPTMPFEEIAALPVPLLAAEKAHLHLWTTNGFLEAALALVRRWGFEFKSSFVWCKPQIGMGNYWRNSHELLLLGVRGGLVFADHALKSWGVYDRGQHSAKPDQIRPLIERAGPPPRLELFARSPALGWHCWGDQVEPDLYTDREEAR